MVTPCLPPAVLCLKAEMCIYSGGKESQAFTEALRSVWTCRLVLGEKGHPLKRPCQRRHLHL